MRAVLAYCTNVSERATGFKRSKHGRRRNKACGNRLCNRGIAFVGADVIAQPTSAHRCKRNRIAVAILWVVGGSRCARSNC